MAISTEKKKYVLTSSPLIIFIRDKVKNIVEPKAERPTRGRPQRFARQKYAAGLSMLMSTSLKEIASRLKVPYTLMRKWAIDPEFKKQVQFNTEEFLGEYMKLLVKEMDTVPPDKVPITFLNRIQAEISTYNPFLQNEILQRVSKLKYERPDLVDLLILVALALILIRYQLATEKKMGRRIKKKDIEELVKSEREIMRSFRDFIGDELMKVLNKPQITVEDRKRAEGLIDNLKGLSGRE
jgi:hypothetical protein